MRLQASAPKLCLAAGVIATVLAGCGGSAAPSNRQQITSVLHSYLHAQADGDGQTACGLLSSSAQNELSTLVVKNSNGLVKSPPSCQDAVGLVRVVAGSTLLGALRAAQVERVEVNGTQATAQIVDGGEFPPQTVTLEKIGSAWKISGVPGLGSLARR
jgi:hypothetical protein